MMRIPEHLARRWRGDETALPQVRASLLHHYYDADTSVEVRERDIHAHLLGRLTINRERVVPWLDSLQSLKGSRILEIGCGTGASTVALLEQGARVTAIDVGRRIPPRRRRPLLRLRGHGRVRPPECREPGRTVIFRSVRPDPRLRGSRAHDIP